MEARECEVVRNHMSSWPLYEDTHQVLSRTIGERIWLGYIADVARWDVNIIEGIFFLLDIKIIPEQRGKGYGEKLYAILEQIARDLGCSQIRQTPSGWTKTGETRQDYLLRRGWQCDAGEVYKVTNGIQV